jgi:1-acyl-sn-glycerol-3-phosphate acyltransferase
MTGIGKKEAIWTFPGFYLAGGIFIDRNSSKGKEVLNEETKKMIKDKVKFFIYPEGSP